MKLAIAPLLVAAFLCAAPRTAAAQQLLGFAAFTINRDVNGSQYAGAAGGVLVDVARSWISLGAQGDLFVSIPYVAGRGGPLVQLNIVRHERIRVFGIGGMGWGEQEGPMFGGGLDVWPSRRVGIRATVQDYLVRIQGFDCATLGYDRTYCDASLHGGSTYTGHQPSFQIGVIWR